VDQRLGRCRQSSQACQNFRQHVPRRFPWETPPLVGNSPDSKFSATVRWEARTALKKPVLMPALSEDDRAHPSFHIIAADRLRFQR